MCTALQLETKESVYFGRNMDIPFFFHQQPMEIPRGFRCRNRADGQLYPVQRQILGMGCVIDGHPVLAEAMNEDGLACAGLNFAGFAHCEPQCAAGKVNLPPYDFILWALSGFGSIAQLRPALERLRLVDVPINEATAVPTLHWMLADRSGQCLVVEATKEGLQVYDNPVKVMTNNPEFPWHLTNLREYLRLSPQAPSPVHWGQLRLDALGVGKGSHGLPGDFASVSRFVRAAFLRANIPVDLADEDAPGQFFHMLDNTAMVRGAVITEDGRYDCTVYSSCMDLRRGIYYWKTCENNRIRGIHMGKAAASPCFYPYDSKQDISFLS